MEKRELTGDLCIGTGITVVAYALMLVWLPLGIAFVGVALIVIGYGVQADPPKHKPGDKPPDALGPFEPGTAQEPRKPRLWRRNPS